MNTYYLGIDIGSTTVKVVILNKENEWYTIIDDGCTISDLKLGGFNIGASAKIKSLLDFIVS